MRRARELKVCAAPCTRTQRRLRALAQHGEARKAHEAALAIAEELQDLRGQAVDLSHLGALALAEGKPDEAQESYRTALRLFQQLREPAMEALAWHQLGVVYHAIRQWDEAKRHYREAARIQEERGNFAAAVHTWNQLALLNQQAGNPAAAEEWYRKAIDSDREIAAPIKLEASPDRTAAGANVGVSLIFSEQLTTHYVFEPDLLLVERNNEQVANLIIRFLRDALGPKKNQP